MRLLFLLIPISFLVFTGCKTAEKSTSKNKTAEEYKKTPELTPEEMIVYEIQNINSDFGTFSAKLDGKFDGTSFGGTLRIKKDSIIWISITKFGFEGARAMFTPDTVLFINKLESQAYAGSYNNIQKLIGIKLDFNILQSILLGYDFNDYVSKDIRIVNKGSSVEVYLNDRKHSLSSQVLNQILLFDNDIKKIKRNYIELKPSLYNIEVNYDSFVTTKNFSFPNKYIIQTKTNDAIRLELKTDKHQVNIPLEFPFSIPSKYELIK